MFKRIISIDWSGAATETKSVALRIAQHDVERGESVLVNPTGKTSRSWSREACRAYLREQLQQDRRTLVAMDFGFGYSWGADRAVFGVEGWHALVHEIRERYAHAGTAQKIRRPVFSLLERGALSELCTFISYDSVRELAEERHLSHLSDTVLEEYAEEAE
jgi:hypothetical protein